MKIKLFRILQKNILRIFLMINIMFLCNSCKKLITWDEFQLQKTSYEGTQLRIDGYFYQKDINGEFCRLECYYRNGVLMHMGGRFTSFKEMDDYVNDVFNIKKVQTNDKECWGLFVINNQNIKTERYYPTDKFHKPAYIREGKVLNDTTFHIITSYRSNTSERSEFDETYYLRKYSPKPDSTNNFIK